MKNVLWLIVFSCLINGQDFKVELSTKKTSYSASEMPFPAELELFNLDMRAVPVELGNYTFIQVWSRCCGAEPEIWAEAMDLVAEYEDQGLKLVSINFENGINMGQMKQKMNEYFASREQPDNLYLDPMGDAIDQLQISGFPTYLLVVDGNVVFRTNGKDPDGMALFRDELSRRLSPN